LTKSGPVSVRPDYRWAVSIQILNDFDMWSMALLTVPIDAQTVLLYA
jgi:hypothetical protein